MEPANIIDHMGASGMGLILAAVLGIVAAAVAGIALARDRRVPAVLAAVGPAIPALFGMLAAAFAFGSSPGDVQGTVAASLGYRLITVLAVMPAAGILLLLTTATSLRSSGLPGTLKEQPRRFWLAGVGALGVLAIVGVPLILGVVEEDLLFAGLRSVFYAVFGLLFVASLFGAARPEGSGADAAAASGVAYCLVVGLGETSGRALAHTFLLTWMGTHETANYPLYVERSLDNVVDPMAPYHWATIALACGLALVCLAPSLRPWPQRSLGALAVLWIGVAPLSFLAGDPAPEVLQQLAEEYAEGLH